VYLGRTQIDQFMKYYRLITIAFLPLLFACGEPENAAQISEANATDTIAPIADQAALPTEYEAAQNYSVDYVMGKFDPAQHEDFVVIADQYANRSGLYLHKETYAAFEKMHEAAKADGVNLRIVSATRPFVVQKSIWEAKWTGQRLVEGGENLAETTPDPKERALKILRYSSMPGTSRHHWGTDIDLNNLTNSYFESGEGKKIYDWLTAHASEYGFCQPYSPKGSDRPNGYNEEKWHWSYLPIARPLTRMAEAKLTNDMIEGFQGAETATQINVVENYILGINPVCK